jgi:transcriptional regulator with XRE-family HTH domain
VVQKYVLDHRRTTDPRRAELADFLRGRREALTPESAGLRSTLRRRTPGLRREEVAELAGISVALYTWLEQGRDVPVSARSIDAIADALRLTPSERTHVQRLIRPVHDELREHISPALQRMVNSAPTHPMFVLDHAWNIVLANTAARAVFGIDGSLGEEQESGNIIVSAFTLCHFRSLFEDWQTVARELLEGFRLDYALYADDPQVQALVERLHAESDFFSELWEQHRVSEYPKGLRMLNHPTAGRLVLEPTLYGVVESPGLRILLFTPFENETMQRIVTLVYERRAEPVA